MSEHLLNALMELIALFARANNTRFIDNAHALLKTYLDQSGSLNNSRIHIRKFYEYFEYYSGIIQKSNIDETSLKKNIEEISKKINSELNEEERMILFLSFLELIKLDKKVDPEELFFVENLAADLHISRTDYKNALIFILCDETGNNYNDNPDFLTITSNSSNNLDELEGSWIEENRPHENNKKLCLHKPDLEGEFLILRLQGIYFLAGRYFGDQSYFINNRKIFPGRFFLLNQFDTIKAGNNIRLTFQEIIAGYRMHSPHASLRLVGENISTLEKGSRIGYAPFNFCEELGNLVVILCNDPHESNNIVHLLTGQLPLSSGKISLNGYDIYAERYRVHKMIGLVPNEAVFDENISIYNNFWFSARLSFPNYPDSKVIQKVNQTILNLGLYDICNLPVKKINNGMPPEFLKILINTGIEIIRDPFVLALDLPFEKLNSSNAEELCQILKAESTKGKLVFVTSINPGACVLRKTDRLWIFDSGGYIIYRGLTNNVLSYFKNIENHISSVEDVCPFCGIINADQLYQIIHAKLIDKLGKPTHERKTLPQEWYKTYKEKIESQEARPASRKIIPSFASSIPNVNIQFSSYLKKGFLSFGANPQIPILIFTCGLFAALVIAGLLRYDWSNHFLFSRHEFLPLLFFLNTSVCFVIGAIAGFQSTLKEKIHIAYDHFKNYSFFSYLNVKYIFLIGFSVVFTLFFTSLTNSISGITDLFLMNWLIYFSIVLIGGSIGLFLGLINLKLRSSLPVLIMLFTFNTLFSGYIVPFSSLPKQIASYKYVPAFAEVFPGRWGYEALIVQQLKNNEYQRIMFKTEQILSDLTFKTNILVPKLQEYLYTIQTESKNTYRLFLISKALSEINRKYPDIFQFEFLDELSKKSINIEVLSELEDYMRYVQFQLYEKLNEIILNRKELRDSLKTTIGNEQYESFLSERYNAQLFSFVSAKKPGKNYVENDNEIIQTDDPIFRLPDNNYGRSHFFAPQKLMNGFYYDTTYFNLFILWLEIFLIYLSTLILRKKTIIE